jgi:hypothetical protein
MLVIDLRVLLVIPGAVRDEQRAQQGRDRRIHSPEYARSMPRSRISHTRRCVTDTSVVNAAIGVAQLELTSR